MHDKVIDELGNIVEIKMWQVPVSVDKPHGFNYSLVYIADGTRVIGFDNAEGKGDHRHIGEVETAYLFTSLRQLVEDFLKEVEQFKRSVK